MPPPMHAVTDSEVPAVISLINRAYEVEKFFIAGDRVSADVVKSLRSKGVFLAADERGALVACVYVEIRGERAYFGLLSVDPSRQGEGWGRRMVDAAEAHARAAGCGAMDIRVVNLRTELPPFYRKLGYSETGTEPLEDPRLTQPAHFVLMSKQL